MIKNSGGITLIALIITIIVLLILAGITINLTIGQGGVIKRAQESVIQHQEQEAREKLELVLIDLEADKKTNPNYNENEYIDSRIKEKGMIVSNDIVFIDDWQFKLDRTIPKITLSLGKGQLEQQLQVSMVAEVSSDYSKAILKIEIAYEKDIKSIILNGEEIQVPEKVDGKYTIEKEVTNNGSFNIVVNDKEEKYNMASIEVKEITEDTVISNLEEFIAFTDRVNKGATYEGKTVILNSDIDLSSVCYKVDGTTANDKSWNPISNFLGVFEGNNHIISNLYINATKNYVGLFGVNKGTIQNLKLTDIEIISTYQYVGGLVGYSTGTIKNIKTTGTIEGEKNHVGGIVGYNNNLIERCINYCSITGKNTSTSRFYGGIVGCAEKGDSSNIKQCGNYGNISTLYQTAGGIAGRGANIDECYNKGSVYAKAGDAGGIIGIMDYGGTVKNCYNTKSISGGAQEGGIVADIYNWTDNNIKYIKNCYNIGTISGSKYVGSITGQTYNGNISSCLWTSSQNAMGNNKSSKIDTLSKKVDSDTLKNSLSTLGDSYTNDVQDEEGNWIYNEGYPILKWELE